MKMLYLLVFIFFSVLANGMVPTPVELHTSVDEHYMIDETEAPLKVAVEMKNIKPLLNQPVKAMLSVTMLALVLALVFYIVVTKKTVDEDDFQKIFQKRKEQLLKTLEAAEQEFKTLEAAEQEKLDELKHKLKELQFLKQQLRGRKKEIILSDIIELDFVEQKASNFKFEVELLKGQELKQFFKQELERKFKFFKLEEEEEEKLVRFE